MVFIIAFSLVFILGLVSWPPRNRGGYRAVDGGRQATDTSNLPKPPKGPGGGSR